jgi:hypothetical protein
LFYVLVSLKVLWRDAGILATPAIAGVFVVATVALAGVVVALATRLSLPVSLPIFVTVAYVNACLGVASGWALAGGRLGPFLKSTRTLATVAVIAVALAAAVGLQRVIAARWPRMRVVVHAGIVAGLLLLTVVSSRTIPGRPAPQARADRADVADIYVLSFDALRSDALWTFVGDNPDSALAGLLRQSTVFENVVAHGLSTDPILANNTFAGSSQTSCEGSLPTSLAHKGHFTAMFYAGAGRRFEGSVCYGYFFAGDGPDLVHRFAVPSVVDAIAHGHAALRPKVLRSDALLGKLAEVAHSPSPLFAYLHFLELHAPYVPVAKRADVVHAASVREYMRRCYVAACDPTRDAALIANARNAYREIVPEVDAAVARALQIARSRGRPFVVVLTADHGELFGEHGGFAHGGGFVPELLDIPFAVFDSRDTTPRRRCELLLSSEALRALFTKGSYPDHGELLLELPLGRAVIRKDTSSIEYELSSDVLPHAHTWRNIHSDAKGTVPYPIATCP